MSGWSHPCGTCTGRRRRADCLIVLAGRADLAERTRHKYEYLLDKHILPVLGDTAIGQVSPSEIRSWHAAIAENSPTTAAGAYRLLGSIMRGSSGG